MFFVVTLLGYGFSFPNAGGQGFPYPSSHTSSFSSVGYGITLRLWADGTGDAYNLAVPDHGIASTLRFVKAGLHSDVRTQMDGSVHN